MDREGQAKRLHRIEGQIRGITRMVLDGRPRDEILTQCQAVRNALKKVEGEVLKDYAAACIDLVVQNRGVDAHRQGVFDLIDFIGRLRS